MLLVQLNTFDSTNNKWMNIGKTLFIAGLLIAVAGLIIWLAGNKLNWLGNLPGDIKIEKENMRFYFPITTMLLISGIVSFILWLIRNIRS